MTGDHKTIRDLAIEAATASGMLVPTPADPPRRQEDRGALTEAIVSGSTLAETLGAIDSACDAVGLSGILPISANTLSTLSLTIRLQEQEIAEMTRLRRLDDRVMAEARADVAITAAGLRDWLDWTGRSGGPLSFFPAVQAAFEAAVNELLTLRQQAAARMALTDAALGAARAVSEGVDSDDTDEANLLRALDDAIEAYDHAAYAADVAARGGGG